MELNSVTGYRPLLSIAMGFVLSKLEKLVNDVTVTLELGL